MGTALNWFIEWSGVDTLIVAAGVSALQPLMSVAGVEVHGKEFTPTQPTKDGIKKAVEITAAATRGNYVGPLVAAITFVRSSHEKLNIILTLSRSLC
jgi:hypothetical protein